MLHSDIWAVVAHSFLSPSDIATLSATCTYIHNSVCPILSALLPLDRLDQYYSRAIASGNHYVAFFLAAKLNRFDDMIDICLADAPLGEHNTRLSQCPSPTTGASPALPFSTSPRGSFSGPSSPIKPPIPPPSLSTVTITQAIDAARKFPEFAGTAACYVVLQWSAHHSLDIASLLGPKYVDDHQLPVMTLLDYLQRLGADLDAHSGLTLRLAALHGDLPLATYLLSHGSKPHHRDARALTWSAAHGHLHLLTPLLDALVSQNPTFDLDALWPPAIRARAFTNAAGADHIHVLKWFENSIPTLSASTLASALQSAALNGHARTLAYLMDSNPAATLTPTHLETIVERGHLQVLKTLVSRRFKIDPTSLLYPASLKGRLEILTYLSDTFSIDLASPPLASKTIQAALKGSHPHVIQYLLDLDAKLSPSDIETAHAAAVASSNAYALRFLHSHADDVALASVLDEESLCEAIADAAGVGWAEGVGILVGLGARLIPVWAANESTPPSSWSGEAGSVGRKRSRGFKGCLRRLRSLGWILEVV